MSNYIGDPRRPDWDGGQPIKKERAAVKKGAALLDKILPGWHTRVTLDELEMSSGSQCMLGQLFGHRVEGQLAQEMYPEEMAEAAQIAGDYGYNRATFFDGKRKTLLDRLLDKLNLSKYDKIKQQYDSLRHVCSGHDNKCLWAEAVADRCAKEESDGSKPRKSR